MVDLERAEGDAPEEDLALGHGGLTITRPLAGLKRQATPPAGPQAEELRKIEASTPGTRSASR